MRLLNKGLLVLWCCVCCVSGFAQEQAVSKPAVPGAPTEGAAQVLTPEERNDAMDAAMMPATTPGLGAGIRVTEPDEEGMQIMKQAEKELGASSGLFLHDMAYDGKRVNNVQVRYIGANQTVTNSRLLDMVSMKVGSKYSQQAVDADLERLVDRGLVSGNTTVSVVPSGNGVSVTYMVAGNHLLAGVGYNGVHKSRQKDLSEDIKLVAGQVLSDKAVSDALRVVRQYYQDARYPDARVSYHYQRTARPGFVDLIIDVNEGRRVNLTHIEFIGNTHYGDARLKRQMEDTQEKGWLSFLTGSGKIDRDLLDDDLQKVVKYYHNEGYLRAQIVKTEQFVSANPKSSSVTLKVTLYEGRRYKVNQVAFSHLTVFTPKELVPALSMYNGDNYSAKKVADDVQMIRRYYGSRGYADASVRPDIQEVGTDKHGNGLINIAYRIEEGNRYRVGNVYVKGNHRSKDYVIRRELPMHSNDFLNAVDMETTQKRLMNMGYFDNVDVTQVPSASPGYRDVQVEVMEKERVNMLTFGLAFSSIQSVYAYGSATFPNFDLYDWKRFSGGGQRLTLSTQVGTEMQNVNVSWVEPWFLHRKLSFGVDLFYSSASYYSDYYEQRNFGAAFTFKKAIGESSYVRLEYKLEQYNIDTHRGIPPFFAAQEGEYVRSHIELGYTLDTRDAMINPRKGGKFEVFTGYSGLGGDVKTMNAGLNYSYYVNLKWDTIFLINGGYETVNSTEGGEDNVPVFERTYLGGPNNLRGFRYRDVGVYDPALSGDETMGGRSSFFNQFEFTIPVIEEMRLAFFYDVGFVHGDAWNFRANKLASDYGIGLRLNLPMGPIAVDYAIPLKTGNAIDSGGRFQFYVNYAY